MDQAYATVTEDASGDAMETAGQVNEPTAGGETRPAGAARPEPAPSAQTPAPAPLPTPAPAASPASTAASTTAAARARCGVMSIAEKARPLRRDAERNRLAILSAARTVFAQRGLEASLDEIAKEAGLGVGTVYRRFPNRDALIDALFTDMLCGVDQIIDEASVMPRGWDGLTHFMESMLQIQATDKALRDVVLARKIHENPDEDVFRERIQEALYDIVERAQQDGDLRTDVAATDIGVLAIAAVGIVEFTGSVAPDVWRRFLAIILDGLRARPAGATSPLEQPALDDDQIDTCMTGWKYGTRETPRHRPKPG